MDINVSRSIEKESPGMGIQMVRPTLRGKRVEFAFKWFPLEAGISSSGHRLIKSVYDFLHLCLPKSGETDLLLANCPPQLLSTGEVQMSLGRVEEARLGPQRQSWWGTSIASSSTHTSSRARHVDIDLCLYTAPSLAFTDFIPAPSEGSALCQAP